MSDYFHSGELAVQAQAGAQHQATRVRRGFHSQLPEPAQRFLSQQRLAVSSVDSSGQVWATLLSGAPGFIQRVIRRPWRSHTSRLPTTRCTISCAMARRWACW